MARQFTYMNIFYALILGCTASLEAAKVSVKSINKNANTLQLTLHFELAPKEVIYHDFITLSVDHPDIHLTEWQPSIRTLHKYVPSLGETKKVYAKDFDITLQASKKAEEPMHNATLHFTYLSSAHHAMTEEIIPLEFTKEHHVSKQVIIEQKEGTELKELPLEKRTPSGLTYFSTYIEHLIETTENKWIRILLVLILGLLMSFTPCLYPMIPITIGIMQGQGDRSLLHNFLHAFSYTIGISTTFALLGLLAAASGAIFGMFLTNPFVVLIIVAMLVYLAFSMFGFYEIYIPRFLQERSNHKHQGSLVSSFLFGAISGTVASPCLSPGLALVLTIVATLGNKLVGFVLLFAFGIGLSIPLLLIGTFSSSLTMLPRAGAWMNEIKTLFGFMLLAMSFYYLKNILPYYSILWLLSAFAAFAGLYYLNIKKARETKQWSRIKTLIGFASLAGSVLLFTYAFQVTYYSENAPADTFWHTNYEQALHDAQATNKLLFLDFWAPSCSICTAIDKTILKDHGVRKALTAFIPAKIELIASDAMTQQLQHQFNIIGLPTLILFDPKNNVIIKRWGGELYQEKKQRFIEELKSYQEQA